MEREFESFASCSKEELIVHGLKALRECLPQEKELYVQNTTVAVVGRGDKFVLYDDENVAVWLDLLGGEVGSTRARQARERENAEREGGGDPPAAAAAAGEDVMQTD